MAAIRTLLRKYWILVVIVLWVIAWANRDRLAGGDEVATATVAETAAPSAGTPPAPVPGTDPSSAAAKSADEKTVDAAAPPLRSDTPARGTAPDASAEAAPRPVQPVASAAEAGGVAKPAEPEVYPAQLEASDTEGSGETGANPAAAVLAQTREAYRSRGPRGAAEALARGLADLPADAPERADLLGELGNFYISAGDIPRALAAYDRALMALSAEARGPMISRLGPVYDRFHPMGRSHLEQFR
ncbi:MAG TPA: hypothetical protein VK855_03015 [Thioalkalivibrio sp.]|nr:hypothetical protein [Thioalkalivibrio sp.]